MLVGCEEALYGISQLAGISRSANLLFPMTGHFNNPGPYGCFIAVSLAIAFWYIFDAKRQTDSKLDRIVYYAACVFVLPGLIVLPLTMSRTAWLALSAILLWHLCRRCVGLGRMKKQTAIIVAFSLFFLLAFAAFFLKPESAVGRFHMWNMETLAILDHPLGTGLGTFAGVYGTVQEEFFREKIADVPEIVIRVAGSPEYPFNEYLGIGIEMGVIGMLVFLVVVVVSLRVLSKRAGGLFSGMLVWSIVAVSSYPLRTSLTFALFLFLLSSVMCCAMPETKLGVCLICAMKYILLCLSLLSVQFHWSLDSFCPDYRKIYDEGYEMFKSGDFEGSYRVLAKGAKVSSDPMFHVVMGRNCEALGNFDDAGEEYMRAWYMVPNRIYPLVRLMRLNVKLGEDEAALKIAETILDLPHNDRNKTMLMLRNETSMTLDSLRFDHALYE